MARIADKLHMHGRPGTNDSKPSFLRSILPLPKAAVMPNEKGCCNRLRKILQ